MNAGGRAGGCLNNAFVCTHALAHSLCSSSSVIIQGCAERDGKSGRKEREPHALFARRRRRGNFAALSRGIAEIMCARLQIKVAKRAIKRHHVQVAGAGVCEREREADMRCALLLSFELTQLNYLS
jgi:hypothetical protein